MSSRTGRSDRFAWLHEGLTKKEAEEGDTIITVDVASPGMLPEQFQKYLGRIALRIDHHASSTSFTDNELVLPEWAACAEIIADLLSPLNHGEMEQPLADAIYVGVSTDTGCFRFANTTAHTFFVAAACASAGARVYQLNQELFETNTLGRLRIQAWIVENIRMMKGGTLAICAIPRAVEQELGVTELFKPEAADLTALISDDPAYVTQAEHAARFTMTEEGVTAAAYTVITADNGAAFAEEEIDFTLYRPFLFVLESRDGLPMFAGVVNEP